MLRESIDVIGKPETLQQLAAIKQHLKTETYSQSFIFATICEHDVLLCLAFAQFSEKFNGISTIIVRSYFDNIVMHNY